MSKQSGLSLIELMISITLGLMLMLGVLNVFLGSKNAFVSQQAISRIQESGRFAIDYMNKEIRMAGFVGCASKDDSKITSNLAAGTDFRWNYKTVVKGYTSTDDSSATALEGLLGLSDIVAGTDVLEVVGASGSQALVDGATSAGSIPVTLTAEANGCGAASSYGGFCVDDVLVVSNCQRAEIFKATGLSTSAISATLTGAPFGAGAEVIKMRKLLFYIKNNTAGIPSLWLWDNGVSSELVEGVEDMDIQYGIDTDANGVPNKYEAAAAGTDWINLKSVHIELLVRTPETTVLPEAQLYSFPLSNATKTLAPDRAMRQVFVSTIAVRSRLE